MSFQSLISPSCFNTNDTGCLISFDEQSKPKSPGTLVKWSRTGDEIWIVIRDEVYCVIRTLPKADGSFVTRVISAKHELTVIQSGDISAKDVPGEADKFSAKNIPLQSYCKGRYSGGYKWIFRDI